MMKISPFHRYALLLAVLLSLLAPGVGAQTFHRVSEVYDPFEDNPTCVKQQVEDPRSPRGVRWEGKDAYRISMSVQPVISKVHWKSLPTGRWVSAAQTPIDTGFMIATDEKEAFGSAFVIDVTHNGKSFAVKQERRMGKEYWDTGSSKVLVEIPFFLYRIYKCLTPGPYRFSAPPVTTVHEWSSKTGKGKLHTFSFVLVERRGPEGPAYQVFKTAPFTLSFEKNTTYELYYVYLAGGSPATAAKPAAKPKPKKPAPANLRVSATLSQVVSEPDRLIHGKPALLAVKLAWDNASCASFEGEVTWTRNGKAQKTVKRTFRHSYTKKQMHDNEDLLLFGFVPDIYASQSEAHRVEVKVKGLDTPVTGSADAALPVDSLGNPAIALRFIPIDIGKWDAKHVYDDQGKRLQGRYFSSLRNKWLGYMRALYPVPAKSIVDTTTSNLMMEITEWKTEKVLFTAMNLLLRLEDYHGLCKGQVDFVVGIVPDTWMGDPGRTEFKAPHAVLLTESAADTILAHEVGHLLKILEKKHNQDEYGRKVLADPGFFITSLEPLSFLRYPPPLGKVDVIDFMDVDPETSLSTWVCRENYGRLMKVVAERFGSFIKAP